MTKWTQRRKRQHTFVKRRRMKVYSAEDVRVFVNGVEMTIGWDVPETVMVPPREWSYMFPPMGGRRAIVVR